MEKKKNFWFTLTFFISNSHSRKMNKPLNYEENIEMELMDEVREARKCRFR